MSSLPEGLRKGVRNAWISLGFAVVFLVLAIPAYRDMERLLVGLGVLSLLIGLAIIGFTAAADRGEVSQQMLRNHDSPDDMSRGE